MGSVVIQLYAGEWVQLLFNFMPVIQLYAGECMPSVDWAWSR